MKLQAHQSSGSTAGTGQPSKLRRWPSGTPQARPSSCKSWRHQAGVAEAGAASESTLLLPAEVAAPSLRFLRRTAASATVSRRGASLARRRELRRLPTASSVAAGVGISVVVAGSRVFLGGGRTTTPESSRGATSGSSRNPRGNGGKGIVTEVMRHSASPMLRKGSGATGRMSRSRMSKSGVVGGAGTTAAGGTRTSRSMSRVAGTVEVGEEAGEAAEAGRGRGARCSGCWRPRWRCSVPGPRQSQWLGCQRSRTVSGWTPVLQVGEGTPWRRCRG